MSVEEYEYYRAMPQRIAQGADLAEFYRLLTQIPDLRLPDIHVLAESWSQWPAFGAIRLHELYGGLEVPHDDNYVLAMVGHLGVRSFWLRHDTALREEVFWRIFEVEGGGEVSLANMDKYSKPEDSWQQTVVELVADGTLDRARVLRCSMEALNRDFSSYRAGWFSRLATALEPSPAELALHQDLLRQGLGASVGATVSYCATQLEQVQRAGLLDSDGFVASAPPALLGGKGTATKILRMLIKLASAPDADRDSIAEVIAHAASHANPDVQRAAVSALQKLGQGELAEQYRDQLSAVVAADLLGATAVGDSKLLAESASPRTLPEVVGWSAWSDQDAAVRMAMLREDPVDGVELEGALAWLAQTERAAEVLRPQAKQAARTSSDAEAYLLSELVLVAVPDVATGPKAQSEGVSRLLASVRDAAHTLRKALPHAALEPGPSHPSGVPSVLTRMQEVADIVRGAAARRTLLATPTDSSGRLDPEVFRERMRAHRAARIKPLAADLTQALLRIPAAERGNCCAEFGLKEPKVTRHIEVEWRSRSSGTRMWWLPTVTAEASSTGSPINPALVPSSSGYPDYVRPVLLIEIGQLAIATPESTVPLTAAGVGILYRVAMSYPYAEYRAGPVLRALARSAGVWTAETVQLVALGMSAKPVEVRAEAVEMLVAVVGERVSLATVVEGFAACAPAVVLSRWASAFADAAALAPPLVVDLLSALLPRLDPQLRDIGGVVRVLHEEHTRIGSPPLSAELDDWLGHFSGSSIAARAATALREAGRNGP